MLFQIPVSFEYNLSQLYAPDNLDNLMSQVFMLVFVEILLM